MRVDKSHLLGQFRAEEHASFGPVPADFADETGYYLELETLHAFLRMADAAAQDDINLTIVSATRNFERQKQIWENKWFGRTLTNGLNLAELNISDIEKAQRILRYSAMPGTSRHHWGTDFDLNSVEPEYFVEGYGLKVHQWLEQHAHQYGFWKPYTSKGVDRLNGYEDEPWHWTYLPVSAGLLNQYLQEIKYADLSGFAGAALAESLLIIPHFVVGVTPECKAKKSGESL